jgi:hypothetical protein
MIFLIMLIVFYETRKSIGGLILSRRQRNSKYGMNDYFNNAYCLRLFDSHRIILIVVYLHVWNE